LDHPRYRHVERGGHQQRVKFLSAIRSGKYAAPATGTTSAEEATEWYRQSAVQECGFLKAGRALQELLRAACPTPSAAATAAAASVWDACCGRGLWVLGFGGDVTPEATAIAILLCFYHEISFPRFTLGPSSRQRKMLLHNRKKKHRHRWTRASEGESDHQHMNQTRSPAVTRQDGHKARHQKPHERDPRPKDAQMTGGPRGK
jgi:hypothetical protein